MISNLSPIRKSDYSLVALVTAIIVTIAGIAANNFALVQSQSQISKMINMARKFEELKGRITLLDESLMISTLMAIETGTPEWQQKHQEIQPQLDRLFEEVISLQPNSPLSNIAAKTSYSNYYLSDMESASLNLIRKGDRQESLNILKGDNYIAFKKSYLVGMRDFSEALALAAKDFEMKINRNTNFINRLSLFFILFISSIWLVAFKLLHSWRKDLIALNSDLDERVIAKSQQLEVERQRSFNSAKMVALGEMAGNIAHEINTPLQVIRLKIHLLEKIQVNEDIKLIKNMTDKIAKIVHGMQVFSRDSKGDDLVLTNLKPIIEDTLEICKARTLKQGVKLEVTQIPDNLMLKCKPTQVSQVLLNLLNNAYDAVEGSEHKIVKVEFHDQGDKFEIDVLDSGEGIDSKIADKIMQPYFTTKGIGKGTGLGLSISRNIMQEHGGELSFSRTENKYTCFSMKFMKTPGSDVKVLT